MEEEDIQAKYIRLQLLDKQIKEAHQQTQAFEEQALEIIGIIKALEYLNEIKPGTEILVPVSSGIFTKAKIGENKKLLMNVGANVVVDKSIEETKKLLLSQIEKVKKMQEELIAVINRLISKAVPLQEEINRFIEKEKKEKS